MMSGPPPVLWLMLLLDPVLSSLPAPVNVHVDSVNFRHVLRWDPGPGTPPGTQFKVFTRVYGEERKGPQNLTKTSLKLKLDNSMRYYLTVQASYNQTLSPESHVTFNPYEDTTIGPPKLSLAGCGNCIHVNVSLHKNIQKFYDAHFKVLWRKRKEAEVSHEIRESKSFTIKNLENGMEYCVQVHTMIRLNQHTKPSAWNCTFTSIVEPSRGPLVLGAVAALLIFVAGVLMTSVFCLHYTGFLCKLKATLPRALIAALNQGYTLTPERTIPDHVSISSEMAKQRKHNNPTTPQLATGGANSEEEEEEEEEGINIYMDRGAELSSGDSSCLESSDVSGNSTAGASGDLGGSWTVEAEVPHTEFEVEVSRGGLDQDEAKAEGAEVSFTPEGGQTKVQRHVIDEMEEEEEEEVVCDSSGNVNLFSVTLGSLAVYDEEETEGQNSTDSLTDVLKLPSLEPPLPTDSKRTLSHYPDSQTESTVALMLPTQVDFTATGYAGRRAGASSGCLKTCDGNTQHEEAQEEEEEEEEEFSGYMRHT
ncbi:interferon lambda receptor 1-like [Enoplosus armatus]|uniref:interferon lambda receptor 1-like n=1 Tax=Enoplosus armatus TaxID=215367 RepID=UPI003994BA4E